MTRWIVLFAAAAMALVMTPAAYTETGKSDSETSDSKITPEKFVTEALQAGDREAALAELAAGKSSAPEIKQFAQMIAADHKLVNEQLRLVTHRDVRGNPQPTPGSEPPALNPGAGPSQFPEQKDISALSGAAFDKAFLDRMERSYERSAVLNENAAQYLPKGAAQKLAEDTLPRVKQYRDQAKSLRGAMEDK